MPSECAQITGKSKDSQRRATTANGATGRCRHSYCGGGNGTRASASNCGGASKAAKDRQRATSLWASWTRARLSVTGNKASPICLWLLTRPRTGDFGNLHKSSHPFLPRSDLESAMGRSRPGSSIVSGCNKSGYNRARSMSWDITGQKALNRSYSYGVGPHRRLPAFGVSVLRQEW